MVVRADTVADQDDMPALTGLRGFAALWVLTYHAWVFAVPREIVWDIAGVSINLTPFFSHGWAGVQIFFVLSGFLLSLPFARWQAGLGARPDNARYLLRRVARVYPAYFVQLAILVSGAWWAERHFPLDGASLAGYLGMLFGPSPMGVGSPRFNGVWWTLPIEFSFYLALPFLAALLAWRRCWLLPVLGLATMVVWRVWVAMTFGDEPIPTRVLWAYQLPGSLDSFCLGMIGAAIHVRVDSADGSGARYRRWLAWALPFAVVLVLALMRWMNRHFLEYWSLSSIFLLWTPLFSLAVWVVVLAGAARVRAVEILLGNRVISGIGVVSYGVYLWHHPVQDWLLAHSPIGTMEGYRFPRLWLASFLVTLSIACLSWGLVERRAIRAARGSGRDRRRFGAPGHGEPA